MSRKIIFCLVLIIGAVCLSAWTFGPVSNPPVPFEPTPADVVTTAWDLAKSMEAYSYSSDIKQTSYPLPSLANSGRQPNEDRLSLDGAIDTAADTMTLTLLQSSSPNTPIEIIASSETTRARVGTGPWEDIDSITDMFAPGRDPLGFLNAAAHIQLGETRQFDFGLGPAVYTQYTFQLDGAAYASYMRAQLEAQLFKYGRPPAGLRLNTADIYGNMTGTGEIWIDGAGLPVRLIIDMEMPANEHNGRSLSLVTTSFSGFENMGPVVGGQWSVVGGQGPMDSGLSAFKSRLPSIGLISGVMLVVTLMFATYKKTRRGISNGQRAIGNANRTHRSSINVHRLLSTVLIFGFVGTPLIQARQTHAFMSNLHAEITQSEERKTAAEEEQIAYDSATTTPWDPNLSPAENFAHSPASKGLLLATASGTDTDGDGLLDEDETAWGTDINDSDSDDDTLSDGEEVNVLGTSPTQADTDGDGISDQLEVGGFSYNGQMWYSNPFEEDSNLDGILDGQECGVWLSGSTNFDENAICPDSDADGTPNLADSDNDGDGVPDKQDLSPDTFGATIYGQNNPLNVSLQNYTVDKPVLFDLMFVPTNAQHLNYQGHILDWPTGDTLGQIQRRLDTTFATTANTSIQSTADNASYGDIRLVPMLEVTMPFESGSYASLPITPTASASRLFGQSVEDWLNTDELDPFGITVQDSDNNNGDLLAYVPLTTITDDTGGNVAYQARMVYQPSQATWGADHEYRVVWMVQMITDECIDSTADPDTCDRQDVFTVAHVYPEEWQIAGLDVSVQQGLESAIMYENPAADADLTFDDQLWTASWNLQNTFLRGRDFDNDDQLDVTVSNLASKAAAWFGNSVDGDYTVVETFNYPHEAYMLKLVQDEGRRILDNTFTSYASQTVPNLLYVHDYKRQVINFQAIGDSFITDLTLDFSAVETDRFASVNMMPYQYVGGEWQAYDSETYLTLLEYRMENNSYFDPSSYSDAAVSSGRVKWSLMYYAMLMQGATALISIDDGVIWEPSDTAPEYTYNELIPTNSTFGPALILSSYIQYFTFALVNENSNTFFKMISTLAGVSDDTIYVLDDLTLRISRQFKSSMVSISMNMAGNAVVMMTAILGGVLLAVGVLGQNAEALQFGVILVSLVTIVITSVYLINAIKAIKGATDSLKAAKRFVATGWGGLVIGGLLTWGLYFIEAANTGFSTIAGQYSLATAIATTIVLVLLLILDLIGFGIIGLLLVILDAILALFGLTGVTAAIVEFIAGLLYDVDYVITNLDDPDRLDVQLNEVDFLHPDRGFTPSNSLIISYNITNTVDIGAETSGLLYAGSAALGNQTITSGYDFSTAADRSKFIYSAGTTQSDTVPTTNTELPHSWVYTTEEFDLFNTTALRRQMQITDTVETTVNLATIGVGLNRSLPIVITEAYLASYEGCWLGFISCKWETFTASSPINVGRYQVYDILPSNLADFVEMDWGGSSLPFPEQVDADADGLTSINGVDPNATLVDGDGDGLTDYYEITNGLDPNDGDADDDGLNDAEELIYKTNPFVADSDGDGLDDRIEAKVGWLVVYNTDQMTRVWSDPLTVDFDGDGLDDYEEFSFGLNPWVATDPSRIDTLVEFDNIGLTESRAPELLLRFNEAADSQIFTDSSGNGQTAVCDFANAHCPDSGVTGVYGSAVHFSSGDDRIEVGNISLSDSFSFAMWLKIPLSAGYTDIFSVTNSSGDPLVKLNGNADYNFILHLESDSNFADPSPSWRSANWHHVVAIYDQEIDNPLFYIDGVLYEPWLGTTLDHDTGFEVEGTLQLSKHADILFDDFAIFDVALSAEEVNAVMNGRFNINDMLVAPGDELAYSATITNTASTTATGYLLADADLISPTLPTAVAAFNFETVDRQVVMDNALFGHSFTCLEDGTCPTLLDDSVDLTNFLYLTHALDFDGIDDKLNMPYLGIADDDIFSMTVKIDQLPPVTESMYLLDTQSESGSAVDIFVDSDGRVRVEVGGPYSGVTAWSRQDLGGGTIIEGNLDPNQLANGGYATVIVGRRPVSNLLYIQINDESYTSGYTPEKLTFGPGVIGNYLPTTFPKIQTPFDGKIASIANGASGISISEGFGSVQFQDQISDGYSAVCDLGAGQCPSQTIGQFDEGLLFDGIDDRLTLNAITLANQSFTIAAWVKRGSSGTIDTFVSQGEAGDNQGLQFGFLSDDSVHCGFTNNDLTTSTTTTDSDWHHWACSYDAVTNLHQIFKDGAVVASRTAPADYLGSGNLMIGKSQFNPSDTQFAGTLDELVLLSGSASASAVRYLMETQTPVVDIPSLFTPVSVQPLSTGIVLDQFQINSPAVSSQHRIEQEVDVALELQSQPTYPVIEANAGDLIVYFPFEEAPGSSFFDNLVGTDDGGWTCAAAEECETLEGQCFGSDCPSAGLRGPIGRAAYFDGVDDSLVLAVPSSNTSLANQKTFAAWVKADSGTIFEALKAGSPNKTYRLTMDQLFAPATAYNGGSIDLSGSVSTDFSKNEWFHVTLTLDTNTAKIYINGQLEKTETFTYFAADDKLGIGSRADRSDSLHGFLDDVRFYDTLLSEAEIATLYTQSAPYMVFDFDESGSQTAFTDRTINALNGQPTINSYFDSTLNETVLQLNPPIGADGKIGNVALFNGSGVIDVTDSAGVGSFTDDFALMMWVKTTASNVGLFNKSDGDGVWEQGEKQFAILADGTPQFSGHSNDFINSSTVINDGAWHHVAVVWDNASGKIYVDGADVTSTSGYAANSADNVADRSFIGGHDSRPFVGQIDELAWVGRVIGSAEINAIYANELRWYRDGATTIITVDDDLPVIELLTDQVYWPDGYIQLAAATRDTTSYVTTFEIGVYDPDESDYVWNTAAVCSEAADSKAAWCPAFDSTEFFGGGEYAIKFRATDAVGNVTTSNAHQLFVDNTAPQISLDQAGRQPLVSQRDAENQWSLALSGELTDAVSSGSEFAAGSLLITLKDSRGQIVGTGFAQLATHTAGSSAEWMLDYLINGFRPVGSHTIHGKLSDNVGNTADVQIGTITLDGRAPKIRTNSWVQAQTIVTSTTAINGVVVEQPDWGREAAAFHFESPIVLENGDILYEDSGRYANYAICDGSGGFDCPDSQSGLFGQAMELGTGVQINPDVFEVTPRDGAAVADHDSLDFTNDFSMGMWLKRTSGTRPNVSPLIVKGSHAGATPQVNYYLLESKIGRMQFAYYAGDVIGWVEINDGASNVVLSTDVWTHVGIVVDVQNNEVRFYKNGILYSTQSNDFDAAPLIENDKQLLIGRTNGDTTSALVGLIDELLIYDRALSADELYALAQSDVYGIQSVESQLIDVNKNEANHLATPWDAALVVGGTWTVTLPSNLEMMGELRLRATDTGGNTAKDGVVWRGLIDDVPPQLSATGQWINNQGIDQTEYTFTLSDFLLDLTSSTHPCGVSDVNLVNHDKPDTPVDGQPYLAVASCRVDGHEGLRQLEACDAAGLCSSLTVTPTAEITKTVAITIVTEDETFMAGETVTISGEAGNGDKIIDRVEVSVNGTVIGTITNDGSPSFSWSTNWVPDSAGEFTLIATVWDVDGLPTSSLVNIEVEMTPVTLTVALNGTGTVSSQLGDINCGSDCSETIDSGTVITLTATPGTNQTFTGWSGGVASADNPLEITVAADTHITASFEAITATLAVSVSGDGSVKSGLGGIDCDPVCSQVGNVGDVVLLTAVPDAGQIFIGWIGDVSSTDNPLEITLTDDTSVTALFADEPVEIITATLTVTVIGSGTVTSDDGEIDCGTDCLEVVVVGETVTLTALPNAGMVFAGWGGDSVSKESQLTVTVSVDTNVTAIFEEEQMAEMYSIVLPLVVR
ncbi:MAG: LamG-like jellyroll fold domain-containing protein [Chloroflexota bacterium]